MFKMILILLVVSCTRTVDLSNNEKGIHGYIHGGKTADVRREIEDAQRAGKKRVNGCLEGTNQDGERPLHLACSYGHTAIVEMLLEAGAKADSEDGSGQTPLRIATSNCSIDCVRLLLKHKANTAGGAKFKDGSFPMTFVNSENTILCVAASTGIEDCVMTFVEHGVNWEEELLATKTIIAKGMVIPVKKYIQSGAPVNDSSLLDSAICEGQEELANLLFAVGAALETKESTSFYSISNKSKRNTAKAIYAKIQTMIKEEEENIDEAKNLVGLTTSELITQAQSLSMIQLRMLLRSIEDTSKRKALLEQVESLKALVNITEAEQQAQQEKKAKQKKDMDLQQALMSGENGW